MTAKKKPAKKKPAKKKPEPLVPYDENMPDICTDGDEHTADPMSFVQSDGAPWVVDVTCSKCHRSGAAYVDANAIQW